MNESLGVSVQMRDALETLADETCRNVGCSEVSPCPPCFAREVLRMLAEEDCHPVRTERLEPC